MGIVEQKIVDAGYEDVVVFSNYDYASAFIGVSDDNRAVYDFEKMVRYLVDEEGFDDEIEAIEWIEYNTLRANAYMGNGAPIVVFPIE